MVGRLFATTLGLLLSSTVCFATITMEYDTTASGVIDGNTIEISIKLFQGGTTILPSRPIILDGVDAPELDQPGGQAAKQFLVELIKDKIVRVLEYTDMGRSRGAWVFLGDTCVNLELVRNGFAWLTPPVVQGSRITPNQILQALEEAKTNKVGIWKEPNSIPPSEWRNRQSGKSSTMTNTPPLQSPMTNKTIMGVVVEARANVKSYEAWNAPSDPYYVLDGVTLRPSSSVSSEDLSKLKGKQVSLMGYNTGGEPYKPEEGEPYPGEPRFTETTNGVADIIPTPPTRRGGGFVVIRVLHTDLPGASLELRLKQIQNEYHLMGLSFANNQVWVTTGMQTSERMKSIQDSIQQAVGTNVAVITIIK